MGDFGKINIYIKYTCHYLLEEVRELFERWLEDISCCFRTRNQHFTLVRVNISWIVFIFCNAIRQFVFFFRVVVRIKLQRHRLRVHLVNPMFLRVGPRVAHEFTNGNS